MSHHHVLDLVGIDIEARDDDQVLLAVDDADETVLVDHGDVTGSQPALFV